MESGETSRDAEDKGPSPARLVFDSMAQRRRSGDCCLVVSLCIVVPVGVLAALGCAAVGGGWVAALVVVAVLVVLPLALLAWLWSVLALDRRVGPCPDCGQMTTFLGPCPTCKREAPGMPTLVNGGCLAVLLVLLVIAGCAGLSWLMGKAEPDKQPQHKPRPPAVAPDTRLDARR